MSDLLFRWAFGSQDTIAMSDFQEERLDQMIWLSKLSVYSFQKWFPTADFIFLYNGSNFNEFMEKFEKATPNLNVPIKIIEQNPRDDLRFKNPYHFLPMNGGVWYKWMPFRYDIDKTEISVDTDIVCLSQPKTWIDWIESDSHILLAPERYETVSVSTCGDFADHTLLKGKTPYNCGIVGCKKGYDYSERFYDITREIKYGDTPNSMFITEQGAINLWVRSLEQEGIPHSCLDFKKNAWMRDLFYFMHSGIKVETVHAVSWHKKLIYELKDEFEDLIMRKTKREDFLSNSLDKMKKLDIFSRHILGRQFQLKEMENEILRPKMA